MPFDLSVGPSVLPRKVKGLKFVTKQPRILEFDKGIISAGITLKGNGACLFLLKQNASNNKVKFVMGGDQMAL